MNETLNGYIAFYEGKQVEVRAKSLYAAKLKALELFKPTKRKAHMLSVVLAEKDGEAVGIHPASL